MMGTSPGSWSRPTRRPTSWPGWPTGPGSLAGLDPDEFAQILISRYPPGSTIGWHRDAPMFGPSGYVLAGAPGRGAASLLWCNRDDDFPAWTGKDLTTRNPTAQLAQLASDGATSATVAGEQLRQLDRLELLPTLATVTMGGNDLLAAYRNSTAARQAIQRVTDNGQRLLALMGPGHRSWSPPSLTPVTVLRCRSAWPAGLAGCRRHADRTQPGPAEAGRGTPSPGGRCAWLQRASQTSSPRGGLAAHRSSLAFSHS